MGEYSKGTSGPNALINRCLGLLVAFFFYVMAGGSMVVAAEYIGTEYEIGIPLNSEPLLTR